jgi:drug/metabolite transporter (DMT)-like permease
LEGKKPAPEYIVIFPSVMDLLSTLLSYTALNMVDSSVWQISRGGNIVTTALLSICLLKRTFSRGALVGCFLAFLGITSVQIVAVLSSDSSSDGGISNQSIGIILLILSIIFNSMGLISEKWIFNKYEISPLKMVFLEGIYGLIVLIPMTIAFQYVSCPWNSEKECVNVDG